ncbi:MOSC domain-containing protein [Pseudonocardia bannensis]|uniref:MOSC domain-containing protein n=1 Tax=Pseudonocardia bannensis TaxID=630973 RepID=A0A848DIG8_9PSEU|nr:MOSC domain-containing protein [Pseudonocardia bannensis]NMH92487.1 MOSC domain-containing protein [Pseudonocardia bannensis]
MADGAVVSLWRYPLKSMQGEELNASPLNDRGLLGDRALALVDVETGKVVSAKNPRKWPAMFDFRGAFTAPPEPGGPLPAVVVTLPDGSVISSADADFDETVSAALGRRVVLASAGAPRPSLEEYWPDMAELAHQETVTDEAMPPGTFFDLAGVHILTTSTINRLRELYPRGRFEVRRFRPNIVVRVTDDAVEFVENKWVGQQMRIGDEVVLEVTDYCPRCVMTTLPQGDLPKDSEILRTAARHNDVNVGVYAEVRRTGAVRRGDPVTLA